MVGGPEARSAFSPRNAPDSGVLIWLEAEALLAAARCTDGGPSPAGVCVVEAVGDSPGPAHGSTVPRAPRYPLAKAAADLHVQYVEPVTHVAYAITW